MTKICKQLFSSWNEKGIRYCHWKGNTTTHLEKGLQGESDLDILIHLEDYYKGCQILKELLFVRCVSQIGSRIPKVEDWIGFDKETGKLIHVHLHQSLVTGSKWVKEYVIPWTYETLETRVFEESKGLYVMNQTLDLITLYTRIGIKASKSQLEDAKKGLFEFSKCFKRDITKEVEELKINLDENFLHLITNKYFKENAKSFETILTKDYMEATDFVALHKLTKSMLDNYLRDHRLLLQAKRIIYYFYIPISSKIRQKRIMLIPTKKRLCGVSHLSIAFLGQDGSGKSTVSGDIMKWLSWKFEVNSFYLGSGDGYKSIYKSLLISAGKPKKKNDNVKSENKEKLKSNTKSSCKQKIKIILSSYYYVLVARHAYKEIRRSLKYTQSGAIALFDRFPQTTYFGIYDGPKIQSRQFSGFFGLMVNLLSKLELYYLNKSQDHQPKVCVKLLLPVEESLRRKPFEKEELIRRKAEITKNLEFNTSQVYEIDATQPYQQELLEIKKIIWNYIVENH